MTIRPLYDRVLVRRKDAAEKSTGGLFIPTSAQEKSHLAEVVAVGQGHLRKDGTIGPMVVEPGMTVLLGKWAGDEVEISGEKHLLVRENDVLAVVM